MLRIVCRMIHDCTVSASGPGARGPASPAGVCESMLDHYQGGIDIDPYSVAINAGLGAGWAPRVCSSEGAGHGDRQSGGIWAGPWPLSAHVMLRLARHGECSSGACVQQLPFCLPDRLPGGWVGVGVVG